MGLNWLIVPLEPAVGIRLAFMIAMMDGSKVDGSQTFGWPLKSHHADAFGRNGLHAQNNVDDCAAMVHFWLSGTWDEAAVGMLAVKLPATIAALGTIGLKMFAVMNRNPA